MYQLLIKAKDATGNKSVEYKNANADDFASYAINFQIISKKSISSVLNYPNPFSTSTQFVYTLTGNEPPAYFKIQIMTITGRVVREITQAELGELKVGTHKTDYAWDGTDQYGDRLAAGVYLYKVIAKKANGEDFEAHQNEKADEFFKNGIGKMVILR
jgi:flagellar hook assembly protein FlgD